MVAVVPRPAVLSIMSSPPSKSIYRLQIESPHHDGDSILTYICFVFSHG